MGTGNFHVVNDPNTIMVLISMEYYARIALDYKDIPAKNQAALPEAREDLVFKRR